MTVESEARDDERIVHVEAEGVAWVESESWCHALATQDLGENLECGVMNVGGSNGSSHASERSTVESVNGRGSESESGEMTERKVRPQHSVDRRRRRK